MASFSVEDFAFPSIELMLLHRLAISINFIHFYYLWLQVYLVMLFSRISLGDVGSLYLMTSRVFIRLSILAGTGLMLRLCRPAGMC